MLSGPGWGVLRCAAGTGFPTVVTNELTQSAGIFQIVVDPSFAFLFSPTPGNYSYYPGYSPASGTLTSPMLYQYQTWIGSSVKHVRNTGSPSYFPAQVGDTTKTPFALPYPPQRTIANYVQYAYIPPPFSTAASGAGGVDEIFTEIQGLNMVGVAGGSTGASNSPACSDPRIPSIPNPVAAALVSVVAGPMAIPNLPSNLRSLGMVQQVTAGSSSDFQAQSFFDMFVQVTLPGISGTGSQIFPGGANAEATLYNDASSPLIVENLVISNLPPTVAYNHTPGSTAVPIKFVTSNPPYWTAGEVLGYLTLAGHGVFSNATTVSVCDRVTGPGGLLDVTLGPVGSPLPGAPVPWLLTTNLFPSPDPSGDTSTYNSSVNTFVDPSTGLTNILDDTASFTTASGTYFVRDLSLYNVIYSSFLQPPLPNNPSYFTTTYSDLNLQLSSTNIYGTSDFFTVGGQTSEPLTLLITNNGTISSTTVYATALEQVDVDLGGVILRVNNSLGQHTIKPDPRGYRVSSYFDLSLQLSDDGGGTWASAAHTMRVQSIMPPAAPNSIFASKSGTNIVLQWQGSQFTLQSTTNLLVPFTDIGESSIAQYTLPMTGKAGFFRLRQ